MKYRDIHQLELEDFHGKRVSLLDLEKSGPFRGRGDSKSRYITIEVQEFSLEFPKNSNAIIWLHTNASYYRVHSVHGTDDYDSESCLPIKMFNFLSIIVNEFIENESAPLLYGATEQIINVILEAKPLNNIQSILSIIRENHSFIYKQLEQQPIGALGNKFMEMLQDIDLFIEEIELIMSSYDVDMVGMLSINPKDPFMYDVPSSDDSFFKCPFCSKVIESEDILGDLIVHIKDHKIVNNIPLLIEWPSPFPSKKVAIEDRKVYY